MNTSTATAHDVRRARRAFVWVGIIVPLLIVAVAVVMLLSWLPDLPERIVTHWGPNGPDGFAGPVLLVWLLAGLGVILPVLMSVPVLFMTRDSWGSSSRFLGAMSLGATALVAVASVGSAAIQRESVDVGFGIGTVMVAGFMAMLVLGAIGWFAQPNVTSPMTGRDAVDGLQLAEGERVAWFGTAALSRPGVITLLMAVVLLIASTVWTMARDVGAGWLLAGVTVLVVALVAMTLVFRVRVSGSGLRVRSVVGWPRWDIAASEITDVEVVHVNPLAEFGGWGVRIAVDGRRGIILRTGEALQITRTTGRVFVVTIDDARTAASVLLTAMKETES